MSYEQLAQSVTKLSASNAELTQKATAALIAAMAKLKVNASYPFTYVQGQTQYDVGVISDESDVTTAGMTLWVEGAIEYAFTVDSMTKFTLVTPEAYADGQQMRIIVNARYDHMWEQLDNLFADEKAGRLQDYLDYLNALGFEPSVPYTLDIVIVRPTQVVRYLDVNYRPKRSALPFTTSTWAVDQSKLIQAEDITLRQSLSTGADDALVAQNTLVGLVKIISVPATEPLTESAYDVDLGGTKSNALLKRKYHIIGPDTAGMPVTGYENFVDGVPDYLCMINESGHNEVLSGNGGRTGVYASRRKIVQAGQGDLFGFNVSARITSPGPVGATHWLANPAAGIINGTVIGEVNGCYLNPQEFYLTDKPGATAYNVTAVGPVVNMNRNAPSGVDVGQVWAGTRYQSTGPAFCDVMVSGTGKWFSGIDLSMPALDFGVNKAAILTKAGDRTYFNALAATINDGSIFIRTNWRATQGFADYSYYDTATLSWKVVIANTEALRVSSAQVSVPRLSASDDIIIASGKGFYSGSSKLIGGRVTGWTRMVGARDKSTAIDTVTGTLTQALSRIAAIEDALHILGGTNGLIGA